MNKKEVIEEIEKEKSNFNAWEHSVRNRAFDDALAIVRKLDEPKKPVVPQYVADFYESIKDDFEYGVYELCVNFYNCDLSGKIKHWFDCDDTNTIQVLVNMHQFGYEVQKEKLYTVELPSPNCPTDDHYILSRLKNGKIIVNRYCIEQWEKFGDCQLTESEIKQDFDWAWKFAKEVNNNE